MLLTRWLFRFAGRGIKLASRQRISARGFDCIMFFVTDKPRLQRLIAISRDDRDAPSQSRGGPFYRIEASGDRLKLTGREVEAEFPATVYEPGVLFLRVTLFRRALSMVTGEKTIAIQVGVDGVLIDNMRLPLETNDMLLYPDPAKAPQWHPSEVQAEQETAERERRQGQLFE